MKTEVINLTSEYTYIRCDDEFSMAFTNGQSMSMWRGFYCFRTAQLQEYNTNNQLIVSTDDNANLWWMCSNTLIMSVTDINNEAIGAIGQLVVVNNQLLAQSALATLNELDYHQRSTNLLESIQNSLSIFLNAYVAANNVQDFGYITGTINNEFNVEIYIAKANKYSFNCGVVYSKNISVPAKSYSYPSSGYSVDSIVIQSDLFNVSFSDLVGHASGTQLSGEFYISGNFNYSLNVNHVGFKLFDNTNVKQTGYSMTNLTIQSGLSSNGVKDMLVFALKASGVAKYGSIFGYNINLNPVLGATYDSVNERFDLSLSPVVIPFETSRVSKLTSNLNLTLPSFTMTETLNINFDIAKT